MSHYARLAALAVRLAAFALFVTSMLSFLAIFSGPWILFNRFGGRGPGAFGRGFIIVPALLYLTLALVLFVASKPLGRFMASDLGEEA